MAFRGEGFAPTIQVSLGQLCAAGVSSDEAADDTCGCPWEFESCSSLFRVARAITNAIQRPARASELHIDIVPNSDLKKPPLSPKRVNTLLCRLRFLNVML